MKTVTTHLYDLDTPNGGLSLELPSKPSEIMHYKDTLVKITDTEITIGYLVDDSDCSNPLEDGDTYGHIYDCRRHSRTLRDYEQALGLSDGGPDYDQVDEDLLVKTALAQLLTGDEEQDRVLQHCLEYWDRQSQFLEPGERFVTDCFAPPTPAITDEDFIRNCLDSANELEPVIDLDPIRHNLWCEGRDNGTIGNPHAVMLDVFEHGQVQYSVSGSGPQCDFDTARGGAVWVPNDVCLEEIKSRAEVYQKGYVKEVTFRGDTWYEVMLWTGAGRSANNMPNGTAWPHWSEAYQALKALDVPRHLPLVEAERTAAQELAEQAADVFTDWCNGNCFGVVVATYDLEGNAINDDACFGFIGDDDAYSSLQNDYFPKEK